MLSDGNSFMSTNHWEWMFSTNLLGSTSRTRDKITPPKGATAKRVEGSGCDQETTRVELAGWKRGGTGAVDDDQEATST